MDILDLDQLGQATTTMTCTAEWTMEEEERREDEELTGWKHMLR
jgi:hypothetical protein